MNMLLYGRLQLVVLCIASVSNYFVSELLRHEADDEH